MRLASVVLGFLLRKVGLFAALILTLFVGLLLVSTVVPTLRAAEAERDRLREVTEERTSLESDLDELRRTAVESSLTRVQDEVRETGRRVAEQESVVAERRRDRDSVCGFVESLPERLPFGPNPCADATRALEKADEALAAFERNLGRAEDEVAVLSDPDLTNGEKLERLRDDADLSPQEREIDNTESDLAQTQAEEEGLREAQGSWPGRIVNLWARSWPWLVGIALVVVVLPGVLRVVSYFLLMPLLSRAQRRIRLAGPDHEQATLRTTEAQRTLTVELAAGEVLSARSEHVRPVRGKIRSRLLYDWGAPFVSFAAGLYGLSRVTGTVEGTSATLATPEDPDSYLVRIDFADHPGLVVHPRHVVGVIGAPELLTRWRWGILALATWQVRYILFAGTGSVVVQGRGDVVATRPGALATRMEQNLVMGFDSRLVVGVDRTEVFWPYLWGRTPLVDDEFTGPHLFFWQKASTEGPSNPVARTFNAFFSALGKLLGF